MGQTPWANDKSALRLELEHLDRVISFIESFGNVYRLFCKIAAHLFTLTNTSSPLNDWRLKIWLYYLTHKPFVRLLLFCAHIKPTSEKKNNSSKLQLFHRIKARSLLHNGTRKSLDFTSPLSEHNETISIRESVDGEIVLERNRKDQVLPLQIIALPSFAVFNNNLFLYSSFSLPFFSL